VAHPRLDFGGSEVAALWAVQALRADHDVSLVTLGGQPLASLNSFCGTSLTPEDVHLVGPWWARWVDLKIGDALRGCLFQRFCRKVAGRFDVLISAYNTCDTGQPAIHRIADFSGSPDVTGGATPPPGLRGAFHRGVLRRAYHRVARACAKPSGRNLYSGEDMILANSRWSAGVLKQRHGVAVDVLYPPVVGTFPDIPPAAKELGFVCIGRVSPEKRVEWMIEIIERVRAKGHDVHLHIIGGLDGAYGGKVRKLARDRQLWVMLEGARHGAEKAQLLSRHRWGIHACHGEAFGIAVAEMVKAGCVPFVPAEGGQAEIVNHPALMYGPVEEAVAKIDVVLRTPALEAELRTHLVAQGKLFSAERYMAGIRQAVETFLERNGSQRGVGR
jgi:glycosyltransferase involved in cell wall biosynthesis